MVLAKTLLLVHENLPAPALLATKSPVPSAQHIFQHNNYYGKEQIFNRRQNQAMSKNKHEMQEKKGKKEVSKDLSFRGLLVHVDIIPQQDPLVA